MRRRAPLALALAAAAATTAAACAPGAAGSPCAPCAPFFFCAGGAAPPLPCTCPAACAGGGVAADPIAGLAWASAVVAGNGTATWLDGVGAAATTGAPNGGSLDAAGNFFFSDSHRVRVVTPGGALTTVAGNGVPAHALGVGTSAQFFTPQSTAVRTDGAVFVAENGAHVVRLLLPLGAGLYNATLFAGRPGVSGAADGAALGGATLRAPSGIAISGATLYVMGNNVLRAVADGVVRTVAGLAGVTGDADGVGSNARFNGGWAIGMHPDGAIVAADWYGYSVRRISPAGDVTTLSGGANAYGTSAEGPAGAALYRAPVGLTVAASGAVVVADYTSPGVIFIVDAAGTSFWAAGGAAAYSEGSGTDVGMVQPCGIGILNGTITFSDVGNRRVRSLTCAPCAPGTFCARGKAAPCAAGSFAVAPLATACAPCGAAPGWACAAGSASAGGAPCPAGFFCPGGASPPLRCTCPSACAAGAAADAENLVWTAATLAGSGAAATANGAGAAAAFFGPNGAIGSPNGTFYVSDQAAHVVRAVSAAGVASLLAGKSGTLGYTNGVGTNAAFNAPSALETDGATVWVADSANAVVRAIALATAAVTTLAGPPAVVTLGTTDGVCAAALFTTPTGLARHGTTLYVQDGARVRAIFTGAGALCTVTTLAGNTPGYANGLGPAAAFAANAWDLDVDGSGNLIV